MKKLGSQDMSEFDRYYHPKHQIVTSKPNAKDVKDGTEIWIKNPDGTYNTHKIISGIWIKTGTNLTT